MYGLASPSVCDLVAKALEAGPGIRELQGLLGTISDGIAKSQGPGRFLPTVQLNMWEGAFGAGHSTEPTH